MLSIKTAGLRCSVFVHVHLSGVLVRNIVVLTKSKLNSWKVSKSAQSSRGNFCTPMRKVNLRHKYEKIYVSGLKFSAQCKQFKCSCAADQASIIFICLHNTHWMFLTYRQCQVAQGRQRREFELLNFERHQFFHDSNRGRMSAGMCTGSRRRSD